MNKENIWPAKSAVRKWQKQIKNKIYENHLQMKDVARRMKICVSTLRSYLTDPDNKSHCTPSYCEKFGMMTVVLLMQQAVRKNIPLPHHNITKQERIALYKERTKTWADKSVKQIAIEYNLCRRSVYQYLQHYPDINAKTKKRSQSRLGNNQPSS